MIGNDNTIEQTPSSSSAHFIKEEAHFDEDEKNNNDNKYLIDREASPKSQNKLENEQTQQQLFNPYFAQFPISISSTNPTAAAALFSQFSAANLFGLLENGFEKTPNGEEENTTPSENVNNNSPFEVRERNESEFIFNNNESFESIFSNTNNCISIANNIEDNTSNIFGFPPQNASSAFNIASPIDQLLHISRQIFGENIISKQQQKQLLNNNCNNITSNSSMGKKGGNNSGRQEDVVVENNTNIMTSSDRKRTYPYTFQYCVLCQKNVHSSKLPCHIRQCHVGKPMFQCPVCDFTSTYSKNNVKSHMVSLHGMAGDPISFMDQYSPQVEEFMKKCFPNVRGRGRPVHGRFGGGGNDQQTPIKTNCGGNQKKQGFKQLLGSPGGDTVVSSETTGDGSSSTTATNEFWALEEGNFNTSPPSNNNNKNISSSRRRQMSNNSAALVTCTTPQQSNNNNNNNIQQKQQQNNNYRNRVSANGHSNKINIQNSNGINTTTSRLFNNNRNNNNNNKRRCNISPLNNNNQTILIEQQSAITPTNISPTSINSNINLFNNNNNGGEIVGITSGNGGNNNELIGAVLEKLTSMPNGFAFNPFIYLQQLNGFFPTFNNSNNNNNNAQSINNSQLLIKNITENIGINFKNKESNYENNLFSGINNNNNSFSSETSQQPTEILLEECLSISQKFLKEINDGEEEEEMIINNNEKEQNYNKKKKKKNNEEGEGEEEQIYNNNINIINNSTTSPINNNIYSEDPLYFPQNADLFKILEGSGLEKTVFNTFSSSNEIIEKFDLSIFETLLEQQSISSGSLLTPTQKKRVADVRSQIGLKSFEIMFAVHRLDSNILTPSHIHLVQLIAPTKSDIRRFALFEQQQHSINNNNLLIDKDEQFIIELSKIERLREKLALMAFIGEFNERSSQLNKKIQYISSASTLLNNSPHFHMILHLLLIAINLINGDFTAKLIKAFHLSKLQKICSFNFPNGFTLLQILGKIIIKYYPELVIFIKKSKIVEEAAEVNFVQLSNELNLLEKGQLLIEEELFYLTEENNNNNKINNNNQQQLINFSSNLNIEIVQLKESMQSLKSQLINTLCFFGEINEEENYKNDDKLLFEILNNNLFECFFGVIANFLSDLNKELDKLVNDD